MRIREALGYAGRGYVKASRALFLVLILVSPVALMVNAATNNPLSLEISNVQASVSYPNTWLSGTVSVSGSWSSGPLHFGGWAFLEGKNQTLASSFTPSSLNYPTNATVAFKESFTGNAGPNPPYAVYVVAYDQNNNIIGTGSTYGGSSGNAMYTLVVELPLFNDTMLGATVQSTDPVINIGVLYNFIMAIALILIVVGTMIAVSLYREKVGTGGIMMSTVSSIIVILIFPMLYNEVATLVNLMTASIITYPSFVSTGLNAAISNIWNAASFSSGTTWGWLSVTGSISQVAIWIMEVIAVLMMNFLGLVRLFLIAALVVAFPLAMGLKLIPFTSKLTQAVQDTLFGLILAAIMSAIVLGVANNVISHFIGSMFYNAIGNQPQWVAIAAIFVAILMPTVFAPLTGIMMQTVSQAAMVSGGTAAALSGGLGLPAAGGAIKGGQAAMGAFQQTAAGLALGGSSQAGAVLGGLGAGAKAFAGTFKGHALRPMLQNAAIIGTTGVMSALGATHASKIFGGMLPPLATHQDVMQSASAAQQAAQADDIVGSINGTIPPIAAGAPQAIVRDDRGRILDPGTAGRTMRLQRIAGEDDFPGAYNYVYMHRGAFGAEDMPSPSKASPEQIKRVGGAFIGALRPYKDNEEMLNHIALGLNDVNAIRPQRPSGGL